MKTKSDKIYFVLKFCLKALGRNTKDTKKCLTKWTSDVYHAKEDINGFRMDLEALVKDDDYHYFKSKFYRYHFFKYERVLKAIELNDNQREVLVNYIEELRSFKDELTLKLRNKEMRIYR